MMEDKTRPSELGETGTGLAPFCVCGAVWSRIGLLFGALGLLKVVLLVVFQRPLFDAYWRVSPQPFNWVNHAVFHLFAVLVGLNLWKLARLYETARMPVYRTVNAVVLVLATGFIFLTFHEGDQGHIRPLMTGVFNWSDLLPYYSLNLFFRPPFLAGWMLAYAAIYYWLARIRRENLTLRVTALFATAYTAVCLRDLIAYREELMVVVAFGTASLLCFRRSSAPLKWLWILLPVGLMALAYISWARYADLLAAPLPEGIVLVGWSLVLFVGATVLAWRSGFLLGWSWVVTFAGITFLLLVNINYPVAENYRNLMCLAVTLPRYFLGEFALALLLLIVATVYRRWRAAGSLLWLDVLIVGVIALALVDLRLAQIMGTRLDWDLLSLALGEGPKMMWRMAQPYLPVATGLLLGLVVVYAGALRGIQCTMLRPGSTTTIRHYNLGYALVAFVLLGLVGRFALGTDKVIGQTIEVFARSSPLGRSGATPVMTEIEFKEAAGRLGMSQLVSSAPVLQASRAKLVDLNVVFVLLESTFNEHLSLFGSKLETQPLLAQYRERMELFPHFYSSFAGSIQARFACYTGLYPTRDHKEFTTQRVGVKSLFEVLSDHGYVNSIFYSSHFDYTGFRDFLHGRNIAEMFDAETMPGARMTKPVSWGLREEETLAAMQQQIRRYAKTKQKFFLSYIPAAPHNPFDGTPERFRKFRPTEYQNFTEAYLNDLLYMDWIVASLLDELKQTGLLDKTLVIITGDHGEMLGSGGGAVGHGWALTPELANVPLIVMDPTQTKAAMNETVGSQVDLLPTILDKLGLPLPAAQLYQGVSLYSVEAQAERTVYLNSFSQYAVMQGRKLVFGDRATQRGATGRTAFLMQIEANRSVFIEAEPFPTSPTVISNFDAFQENLLRNYSHYCQELAAPKPVLSANSRYRP